MVVLEHAETVVWHVDNTDGYNSSNMRKWSLFSDTETAYNSKHDTNSLYKASTHLDDTFVIDSIEYTHDLSYTTSIGARPNINCKQSCCQ